MNIRSVITKYFWSTEAWLYDRGLRLTLWKVSTHLVWSLCKLWLLYVITKWAYVGVPRYWGRWWCTSASCRRYSTVNACLFPRLDAEFGRYGSNDVGINRGIPQNLRVLGSRLLCLSAL